MYAFLKLIRWPNLIIVALTQLALFFLILHPTFSFHQIAQDQAFLILSLIIIGTCLIAASGYVINDIMDLEIDLINKGEQVLIGDFFSKKGAFRIYYAIVLMGFMVACLLAFLLNKWSQLWIYPLAIFLLYIYSSFFKKTALLGNILVSLFTAFVVMILMVAFNESIKQCPQEDQGYLYQIAWTFTWFSFLSNLFREMVKDLEDIEGDRLMGARTAPVVFGIPLTKTIASLSLLAVFIVFYFFVKNIPFELNGYQIIYPIVCIVLPSLFLIFLLWKRKHKQGFHQVSILTKIYMLFGLVYLFLFIKYPIW